MPDECASSTRMYASCSRHTSTISRSGATSPRIEYNPSTTTSRLRSCFGSRTSFLARFDGELCCTHTTSAPERRVADAGVAFGIEHHHIARAAQRADHAEIRLVAGRENACGTFCEEACEVV